MKGIGDSGIFAPNQTTTRAMAATVLSRMTVKGGVEGAGCNNPFTDVVYNGNADDPWYAGTVLWAAETGIVTGYEQADGTAQFRPESNVNRAEFCIMMQRYAAATGQGVALEAGEADEILAQYRGRRLVPAWAKEAVAWAVKNGVSAATRSSTRWATSPAPRWPRWPSPSRPSPSKRALAASCLIRSVN